MFGTGRLAITLSIAVAALALLPCASEAQQPKGVLSRLDDLVFARPELRVVETNREARSPEADPRSAAAVESFRAQHGPAWSVWVDQRRGRPSLIDGGAIPFLPGPANGLSWEEFAPGCRESGCIPVARAEHEARTFLERWRDLLGVRPEELVLDPAGSMPVGGSYYFLRFQWAPGGIPVEGASVYFRINGGNLLQVATTGIADLKLDLEPALTPETAWQVLAGYLGESPAARDEILDHGRLVILPVTPKGMDPERYEGALGSQIGYRLCYRLAFHRPGVIGTWEALVDAHTGELQRFVDTNDYGTVRGTVYANDGQANALNLPLPFVKTDLPAPDDYSDAAGRFEGTAATVGLGQAKYIWVTDACGATTLSTADGEADYGQSVGTDCGVPSPNPGAGGNTWSSKTLYYHLTHLNRKAAAFLPDLAWLASSHATAQVNGAAWCNALASTAGVEFFKREAACLNLGGLPGTIYHEYGHTLERNDGSGERARPVESDADWTAALMMRSSCPGAGSGLGVLCSGYGDPCTQCDGARDLDFMKHADATPWTAQNHGTVWDCGPGGYNGPCGWEDHCESGISSQALWDFVNRDLPADCGVSGSTAWHLAERLYFSSLPSLGYHYTCTVGTPTVTDGCGGASLYTLMRVLDDSGDGTANGTPHARAIYHALARHNIACGAEGDAANQNQTTCPGLLAPALSGTVGHNRVSLSWTDGGPSATRYFVYKNDAGPDRGYSRIATVSAPQRAYVDATATTGITSYYEVQAATGLDACAGPVSNVVAATPVFCSGVPSLDRTAYRCSQTVSVSLDDSTAGAPVTVTAWSTTDPSPVTVTLAETAPGSGRYAGTFLTSATAGAGKVRVSHSDTLTVRYTDPDSCGDPGVVRETTASIDCLPPVISAVGTSNVTGASAVLLWTTDEPSDSRVQYGPPAGSSSSSVMGTHHAVEITGLAPCTTYLFDVASEDPLGQLATDDNGGAHYTFTTTPDLTPVLTRTPNQAIPDNDPAGGWSALLVTDGRILQDLDVEVSIQHPTAGQLRLTLRSPDGTEVALATNVGGTGSDYTGTLFDDEAARPVAQGLAPLTGRYRPEGSLSVFDGKNASGNWRLTVADTVAGETGTVLEWKLRPTYAAYSCGSELLLRELDLLSDTCSGTGTGADDGILDAGEEAVLRIGLLNNGSVSANQVSATLTSASPLVTILDGASAFDDILPAGVGHSVAPHFKIRVSPGAPCGAVILFTLHVTCYEDPAGWDRTFLMRAGEVIYGDPVEVFHESFSGTSLPEGWSTELLNEGGGRLYPIYDFSCESGYALRHISWNQPADVWVHTSGIALEAGVPYTLSFLQWAEFDQDEGHSLSFWLGAAQEAAAMTQLLWSETGLADPTCTTREAAFTVDETGTYYLGAHCNSPAHQGTMFVDDVRITHPAPVVCAMNPCCSEPAAPAPAAEDFDECYATGVRVAWAGVPDATAYDVEVDGAAVVADVSSPYLHLPGDSAPQGYKVRARSRACTGPWSGTSSASDLDLTPGSPAAPAVADLEPCALTGVRITWDPVAHAESYDLLLDGTTLVSGAASPHTYQPGDSASHAYQVRARRASCKGAWSAAATGTDAVSLATPAPPEVTDLDPCAQTGVSVSWAPVPGAAAYDLIVDGGELFPGVTSPHTHDPRDTASHGYAIQARAAGCAEQRSDVTARADQNKTPAVPASLRANDLDACAASGIRITWDAVTGATAYELLVDGTTTLSGVASPYTHQPGDSATHTYRVRARTDTCASAWSDQDAAADQNSGLAAPAAPRVQDPDTCAGTGLEISWEPLGGATYYDLRVDGAAVYPDVVSPKDYDPADAAAHTFELRGRNASCTGPWSPVASGTDQDDTPGSPVVTSVVDADPTRPTGIRVNYAPGGGAARHDLLRDGALAVTGYGSGALYVPGDPDSHAYRVRAWNAGCTSLSNTVAGADGPAGIPPEIAPGDTPATAQSWPDKTTQAWPGHTSCASGYLLYRGTRQDLPELADSDEDSCLRYRGTSAGETTASGITEDPSGVPGRFYWYVVTGLNAAGEGAAGSGTPGPRSVDSEGDCLEP